jgi:general secretion pathway protein F
VAAFHYVAIDAAGRRRSGVVESDSSRLARQRLREMGLIPERVRPLRDRAGRGSMDLWQWRLGHHELALFTRQIATLLRAGIPLEEALRSTAAQTTRPRVARLVADLRAQVMEGNSLSTALGAYPQHFSVLYRASIGAAEAAGRLDVVLGDLEGHLERGETLRRKVQIALAYPLLLLTVSTLVVLGLVTYVVPQIATVFVGTGQPLPPLTRGVIAFSSFLREHATLIGATAATLALTVRPLMRSGPIRRWLHGLVLHIPALGQYLRARHAAQLTRTLAMLVNSGVPLLDSLTIAAGTVSNDVVQAGVHDAAARVREGESLHRALGRSGHVPPVTLSLVACGEAAGNLGEMLAAGADDLDRGTTTAVDTFLALFEPLLILVMGGAVLTIVLAILLPIFEMNQLVG